MKHITHSMVASALIAKCIDNTDRAITEVVIASGSSHNVWMKIRRGNMGFFIDNVFGMLKEIGISPQVFFATVDAAVEVLTELDTPYRIQVTTALLAKRDYLDLLTVDELSDLLEKNLYNKGGFFTNLLNSSPARELETVA